MAEAGPPIDTEKCVIAVSSQVLLDLGEATIKYEDGRNLKAYLDHMMEKEDKPSDTGPGAGWVFLKSLNTGEPDNLKSFEIILITRHHIKAGACLIKAMRHNDIEIDRASFCEPTKIIPQLQICDADLFLSTDENLLTQAVQQGIPAALMRAQGGQQAVPMVTIAFQENSLEDETLIFEKFVEKIGKIKKRLSGGKNQIKTYLLTTRKKETVMESLDYGMFKYLKLNADEIKMYDSLDSERDILKKIPACIYFCFKDHGGSPEENNKWKGIFKAKIWQRI